jgi:hypothetical protein
MILSVISVVVALLTIFVTWRMARGQRLKALQLAELTQQIRPVDLDAFHNLMSLEEEEFLRTHLAPRMFRKTQRRRIRAAMGYVSGVATNAVILLRVGELARGSSDPDIPAAGQELVEAASRLRVYSILVLAKLSFAVVLPGVPLSAAGIADGYKDVSRRLDQLSRLRVSSGASRISATL